MKNINNSVNLYEKLRTLATVPYNPVDFMRGKSTITIKENIYE